jgi:hypothetical protein
MTLLSALYEDMLQNPCPSCRTVHMQKGRWFATVTKYQCLHCDLTVLLTYQRKVEIFTLHQARKDKIGT